MRLAFVARVPCTGYGGVRRVIENLAEGLRAKGHEVDIVLGGPRQRWIDFWWFPLKILVRSLRSRWDLVIAHSADGTLCALGSRLWRRVPPVVMHSHGWEECAFESWLALAGTQNHGPTPLNRLIAKALRFPFLRLGLRFARKVVFVAEGGCDWVKAKYPQSKDRLFYIPNGFDSGVFTGKDEASRSDSVLFVGNWTWKKGHFLLEPVLRAILSQHMQCRANIAGTDLSPEERLGIFGKAALERMSFYDNLQPAEMAELYRRSGVLLHLSLYEGGIPSLALLEAMACGVAVVAFAYPGLDRVLHNGKEAILVPVGDTTKATDKALEILSNAEIRDRLIAAGRARAQDFSWAKAVEQWNQLIGEIKVGPSWEGGSAART